MAYMPTPMTSPTGASPRIITVFASSSPRTPAAYCAAAAELGRGIAEAGWILRNGAGADGGMGAMTDAALAAGGVVQGVNLQAFVDQGFLHSGLDGVRIVPTMRERKRLLGEEADAFVALPGGPGTWEELWEVVVERQIGSHAAPLILCNVDGFYDGFITTLQRAAADGLLYGPAEDLLHCCPSSAGCLAHLKSLWQ
ncbi:MAG: TIGR00730 family Rossman fold protein [Planctomycetota bacterium]|nr:MAG: TIGR00730 family Rossman fold protein [Planctomycetota bacterium]